jgi:hypothetical protein
MTPRKALAVAVAAGFSLASFGCGGDEQPYVAKPAVSGKKPTLPAVPTLPTKKKKDGDAYTIWGIIHDLRSRVHHDEVDGKKVTIVGYVTKTNYDQAPKCAVHKTGKGDPEGCNPPVPSFSIADEKGETKDTIDVMGWASNFAQMYSMIEAIDKAAKGKEGEVKLKDEFLGAELPNPIPNIGARVKVTGTYGVTFTKGKGAAADPKHGILTYESFQLLEPAPEKAYLPGMKKK